MKKAAKLGLSALALLLVFYSCKKEETPEPETPTTTTTTTNNNSNNNNNPVTQGEYIQCKIDGKDFLSKDDDENRFSYARINFGQHHLKGADSTTQSINLWFFEFDSVGTYPVGGPNNVSCQWLTTNPLKTYDCSEKLAKDGITTGQIVVTHFDGVKIEGTFEFTAVFPDWNDPQNPDYSDKVTVTEGKFRLNYK
ncbi:hypothetical protein KFE98_07270 [bacterium SCSIO 12741]|nr:hypothetical protein KFE98_07270 [bacterium SCSIO 12741]